MKVRFAGIVYHVTEAYLAGADAVATGRANNPNPYKPGPQLAQYNYGRANELRGAHDDLELEINDV